MHHLSFLLSNTPTFCILHLHPRTPVTHCQAPRPCGPPAFKGPLKGSPVKMLRRRLSAGSTPQGVAASIVPRSAAASVGKLPGHEGGPARCVLIGTGKRWVPQGAGPLVVSWGWVPKTGGVPRRTQLQHSLHPAETITICSKPSINRQQKIFTTMKVFACLAQALSLSVCSCLALCVPHCFTNDRFAAMISCMLLPVCVRASARVCVCV